MTPEEKEAYVYYEMHPIEVKVSFDFEVRAPQNGFDPFETPILINSYNRLDCLSRLVERLVGWGYSNLYLIDNGSTYQPLLDYYKNSSLRVFYLDKNVGYLALWKTEVFSYFENVEYVYTDPDVLPAEDCPPDFISRFKALLDACPDVSKVGCALRIDDLPSHYGRREEVIKYERQFWSHPLGEELYEAPLDTTFALYRAGVKGGGWLKGIRCGEPCWAHHLPWYEAPAERSEEERHYQQTIRRRTHWVRSEEDESLGAATLNDYFDQIYCINLDRREDRWERVVERFERAGVVVKRISAVDGASIPPAELPPRSRLKGVEPNQSIAALCGGWLSHRAAFLDARIHGHRRVLIFEDDVVLSEGLNEKFYRYLPEVPKDWSLLYLGGNHVDPVTPVSENVVRMNMSFALHAYAVDQSILESLLKFMTPDPSRIPTVVDVYLGILHKRLPAYCFSPPMAWQEDGFSDYQEREVTYPFLR